MDNLSAINAATLNGAKLLGIDNNTGSVESGKFADLIVLNADPLADISVLTKPDNIQVVIIDGNIVKNE